MISNRAILRAIYRDYFTRSTVVGYVAERLLCQRQGMPFLHVTRSTDLVVEGYPRSGANFAAQLLRAASENELSISFRRHTRSQLRLAFKYDVPVLLLFRDPVSVSLSYAIATEEKIPLRYILKAYISYYVFVEKLADRLTLFDFRELQSKPQSILDIASELGFPMNRFNSELKHKTEQMAGDLYTTLAGYRRDPTLHIREAPLPSKEKETAKQALRSKLESEQQLLKDAKDVFERLCRLAKQSG